MKTVTDSNIDGAMAEIVNAFLRWPLPESVSADGCATRPGKGRTGTNLLTCPETLAMVQEVVRPVVERLIEDEAPTLRTELNNACRLLELNAQIEAEMARRRKRSRKSVG